MLEHFNLPFHHWHGKQGGRAWLKDVIFWAAIHLKEMELIMKCLLALGKPSAICSSVLNWAHLFWVCATHMRLLQPQMLQKFCPWVCLSVLELWPRAGWDRGCPCLVLHHREPLCQTRSPPIQFTNYTESWACAGKVAWMIKCLFKWFSVPYLKYSLCLIFWCLLAGVAAVVAIPK